MKFNKSSSGAPLLPMPLHASAVVVYSRGAEGLGVSFQCGCPEEETNASKKLLQLASADISAALSAAMNSNEYLAFLKGTTDGQ